MDRDRDVLALIRSLRDELGSPASEEHAMAWWNQVELIAADVEMDARATGHERELVALLKEHVSAAILAVRQRGVPDTGRISADLTGLLNSLERRTTGADGRPLREG